MDLFVFLSLNSMARNTRSAGRGNVSHWSGSFCLWVAAQKQKEQFKHGCNTKRVCKISPTDTSSRACPKNSEHPVYHENNAIKEFFFFKSWFHFSLILCYIHFLPSSLFVSWLPVFWGHGFGILACGTYTAMHMTSHWEVTHLCSRLNHTEVSVSVTAIVSQGTAPEGPKVELQFSTQIWVQGAWKNTTKASSEVSCENSDHGSEITWEGIWGKSTRFLIPPLFQGRNCQKKHLLSQHDTAVRCALMISCSQIGHFLVFSCLAL